MGHLHIRSQAILAQAILAQAPISTSALVLVNESHYSSHYSSHMAGNGDSQSSGGQDIFYVCKKSLLALKEKMAKGEAIEQDAVYELTFAEVQADDDIMVPVDMAGVGKDFEDVEEMIEILGAKGTAEAFLKAHEYFEANKDGEPADERPKPMTAAEWRSVFEEFEESEEDSSEEGDEECGAGDDAEDDDEPAAKKAKTA